jgi:hypothetical protein
VIPALEKLLDLFGRLSPTGQAAALGIAAFGPAALSAAGSIAQLSIAMGGLKTALAGLGAFAASPAGIAALALIGVGTAAYGLYDLVNNQIPANVRNQLGTGGPGALYNNGDGSATPDFSGMKSKGLKVENGQVIREKIRQISDVTDRTVKARKNSVTMPSLSASDLVSSQYEGQAFDPDVWKEAARRYEASQKGGKLFGEFMTKRNEEFKDRFGKGLERESDDLADAQRRYNRELREAIELAQQMDTAFQFMKGLRGETDATAQAFNQLGQSIGDSFGDLKNLLGGLKNAFLSFVRDIAGNALRNVAASAIAPIVGSLGGRTGGAGSIGGFGSLAFGSAGSFLTGGFAGGNPAGNILGGSYSQQAQVMQVINQVGGGSAGAGGWIGSGVPSTAGKVGLFSGLKNSLRSTFSSPLAAGALGASLGGMLGGQSVAGNILGAGGGALVSAGLGGLITGSMSLAVAGPLAAVGVPLLIGSILLGKAKQRKADESVVDTYWMEYSRVLKELTSGVNADRIMGDDALGQAAEARQTAVDLISQIKTKSVRESRLQHQIPQIDAYDLRNLQNAVASQKTRLADQAESVRQRGLLDSRLVPEFATGGVVPGPIGAARYVMAHAGEVILNARQQAAVGQSALANAGVPGLAGSGGNGPGAPVVNVHFSIGRQDQSEIVSSGIVHPNTRNALTNALKSAIRYS